EMVLGPSTSALLRVLAGSLGRTLRPGDEIIVTDADHEANVGPWTDLERDDIVVRWWKVNRETAALETEDLRALLTDRTRLVAATHASNLVGTVHPVAEWARVIHDAGALLCIDGVAFAPHRRIDVRKWDVDFYVSSLYKVYGPHLGALYGKREHLERLPRYNHFFLEGEVPYKFQPGNLNYELTWGAGAIVEYLESLGSGDLDDAFARITAHEHRLGARLLDRLREEPRITVIGQDRMTETRVPTVSFTVEGRRSSEIPPVTDAHHIGIRWGDFYAVRLVEALGLEECDGVVRVSAVHYNTEEEIDRLLAALEPVFEGRSPARV
ncbi:MAG: aminotransferase class V-fold PLP-dependent enzyme, partial [Gemmatimonadetes bacterium]|nr:aminotransferase class V-fold PLP-dependent enzyme [Gemmatimonadota bacterium]